jgi:hypothetical protein
MVNIQQKPFPLQARLLYVHYQNNMSLLSIILLIVIIGVVLWAINSFIPLDANIKKLLNVVIIIVLVIFLLKALGAFAYLGGVKI